MKRNMMRKNLTQGILKSLGRYIAIVAIIALGCAIFVGLKITKTDMVATGQDYTEQQNMFDLQLLSTYGWTQKEVEAIRALEGVEDAEGSIYLDAYVRLWGEDKVYRFYSIPQRINKVYLLSGRMPEKPDECLVDAEYFGEDLIGSSITLSDHNESDTMDSLKEHTFTIVGRISTPLYMDMTRGSTTLGSGSLMTYVYIPQEAFSLDYYTEVYVTMPGSWQVYSTEHNEAMDALAERFKTELLPIAQQRLEGIKADAEKEYLEGLGEYEDAVATFEKEKANALAELDAAYEKLAAAQAELDKAKAEMTDGEAQIADAQQQLDAGRKELDAARIQLENAKVEAFTQIAAGRQELIQNQKMVEENLLLMADGLVQIENGLVQIEDGLKQIEQAKPLLTIMVSFYESNVKSTQDALNMAIWTGNESLIQLLTDRLTEQTDTLNEYTTQLQQLENTETELKSTRLTLQHQKQELLTNQKMLEDSKILIQQGFVELEQNESLAQSEFAAAEAKITSAYVELEAGQRELDAKRAELEAGKAQLLAGEAELKAGWEEYESGRQQAEKEFADAETQLADAKQQLEQARQDIDSLAQPDLFALTRNTNAGYLALDSNSDIVSGIARILPVFFLLIAALVCITTMTRMVEEERTQIGTLKALGYGNMAIMSKYLLYSASAAVIGCSLGVLIGSTFFPVLLWNAYKIIFNIRPDVVLTVDWVLSIGVALAYILVSSAVTWYCCRRTLKEVPAELIRPRAPDAGKAIFLEKLFFWKKLSFLNKVMLRNVFRYRQRFLMMLIGIGGCTALLLTGFGLRDTVVDVANVQFEEVNQFDIDVYFSEGQTPEQQKAFTDKLRKEGLIKDAGFFYQTSLELTYDHKVRDVFMICADDSVGRFINLHYNEEQLGMPAVGEAFLSVGVCEILNIGIGDTVSLLTSDMQTLEVKVAGIYENHVQNYVLLTPETLQAQWGSAPLPQKAFVQAGFNTEIGDLSAAITNMDSVLNITVSEDTADMVNSMMDALDMVVVVIVFCAGLLAAIVLYNLTNININERIREIATIKVLGFNAGETSAYVFKENILLTVFGIVFGLPLGRWFMDFIMLNLKIDMVWFKTRINFPSYVYAVLLTILCAAIVDFVFHFRLQKINMAEALKSVE